jgi:hypothetical protein
MILLSKMTILWCCLLTLPLTISAYVKGGSRKVSAVGDPFQSSSLYSSRRFLKGTKKSGSSDDNEIAGGDNAAIPVTEAPFVSEVDMVFTDSPVASPVAPSPVNVMPPPVTSLVTPFPSPVNTLATAAPVLSFVAPSPSPVVVIFTPPPLTNPVAEDVNTAQPTLAPSSSPVNPAAIDLPVTSPLATQATLAPSSPELKPVATGAPVANPVAETIKPDGGVETVLNETDQNVDTNDTGDSTIAPTKVADPSPSSALDDACAAAAAGKSYTTDNHQNIIFIHEMTVPAKVDPFQAGSELDASAQAVLLRDLILSNCPLGDLRKRRLSMSETLLGISILASEILDDEPCTEIELEDELVCYRRHATARLSFEEDVEVDALQVRDEIQVILTETLSSLVVESSETVRAKYVALEAGSLQSPQTNEGEGDTNMAPAAIAFLTLFVLAAVAGMALSVVWYHRKSPTTSHGYVFGSKIPPLHGVGSSDDTDIGSGGDISSEENWNTQLPYAVNEVTNDFASELILVSDFRVAVSPVGDYCRSDGSAHTDDIMTVVETARIAPIYSEDHFPTLDVNKPLYRKSLFAASVRNDPRSPDSIDL